MLVHVYPDVHYKAAADLRLCDACLVEQILCSPIYQRSNSIVETWSEASKTVDGC